MNEHWSNPLPQDVELLQKSIQLLQQLILSILPTSNKNNTTKLQIFPQRKPNSTNLLDIIANQISFELIQSKQVNSIITHSNSLKYLPVIRLRRIRKVQNQQIDHRRNLVVIPSRRELLHDSLDLTYAHTNR